MGNANVHRHAASIKSMCYSTDVFVLLVHCLHDQHAVLPSRVDKFTVTLMISNATAQKHLYLNILQLNTL